LRRKLFILLINGRLQQSKLRLDRLIDGLRIVSVAKARKNAAGIIVKARPDLTGIIRYARLNLVRVVRNARLKLVSVVRNRLLNSARQGRDIRIERR